MTGSETRVRSLSVRPVSFRLKTPFITAAGRKTRTHNLQIRLALSNGITGISEASTSIAMREQTPAVMARAITKMAGQLKGEPIQNYRKLARDAWALASSTPTAAAAIECALWDAWSKCLGQPLWKSFGPRSKTIETDLTLSLTHPDETARAAHAAVRQGFRRLKVKLGGEARLDWARLRAAQAVAPRASLVADGNQGFTLAQALELDRRLAATGVRVIFFEQPFRRGDTASMVKFRHQARSAIVADESVRSSAEAEILFRAGAIDGVNIKLAKSGIAGALEIIRVVRRHRGLLSIGCMEESKIGLAASVHLACASAVFDWVDLDSAHLLRDGGVAGGFHITGPRLSVQHIGPGIGAE